MSTARPWPVRLHRGGSSVEGALPKPPQGHAGFRHKIKREPVRGEGARSRYSSESARGLILAAARKAAEQRGYEAMRVYEITDAIGVTRQAFYAHFRDKRHCLAEAIDPKLGEIERMTASLADSDADSACRIVHALDDLLCERFGSAEGTRGRILAATRELLSEGRTLHEITIGQIVKAAHVPQGDFYRQFSTKRECFAVHYEQLLDELVAELEGSGRGERGSAAPPRECPAEHIRHDLPALLASLGEQLAADPERLRILIVESAHLPEASDSEQAGAWRGSLTDAIAGLISSSQDADPTDPRIRWLAASTLELIRSATLTSQREDLAERLLGFASDYAPSPLAAPEQPLAA